MVGGLAAHLHQAHAAAGLLGGLGNQGQEAGAVEVVGAGAGHQEAARRHHFQGAAVDGQVTFFPLFEMLAALDEGRRVENDRAEAPAALLAQKVEDVGGDEVATIGKAVQVGILPGLADRRGGNVNARDVFGPVLRGVQRPGAGVAEEIENLASRTNPCRCRQFSR